MDICKMTDTCCNQASERATDLPLGATESRLVGALLGAMKRPQAIVEEVALGDRFIAVAADGRVGLASLLGVRPDAAGSSLLSDAVGKTAADIAGQLRSASPFAIRLGLAALNAADTCDAQTPTAPAPPADALVAAHGKGRSVGVVGHFPFVEKLREQVGTLHLFELRDVPGAVTRERWESVLANLDVLAVTATALLTRHMAYFLSHAANAVRLVVGPSTPFSQAMFQFGADYLCGSVVTDVGRVLAGVRQGLPFRAIKKGGGLRFFQLGRSDPQ